LPLNGNEIILLVKGLNEFYEEKRCTIYSCAHNRGFILTLDDDWMVNNKHFIWFYIKGFIYARYSSSNVRINFYSSAEEAEHYLVHGEMTPEEFWFRRFTDYL
jgi:hypothetical protein